MKYNFEHLFEHCAPMPKVHLQIHYYRECYRVILATEGMEQKSPWSLILALKLWNINGQSPSRFIATLNVAWPVVVS